MILDVILALLVAALGFSFRYLDHADFANEQFIHLARSQAWLAGDWPIRDYTEPGAMLTSGISAVAQALLGPTLLSELLLSISALSVAAAVTAWVTTQLTGRRALGVFAALLQIGAAPVLFAYPKLLIYPVVLALGIAYARLQTRPRLILLAGWTAIAFLIRQDHGVYAFVTGLVLVGSVHHEEGLRATVHRAGLFVSAFLLCLTPFLMYVQAEMGLWSYVTLGIETSRSEAERSVQSMPTFGNLAAGPLFVLTPLQERDLPGIHIRWSPGVTQEARIALERRGQLLYGEALEGRTWGYRVNPDALDALGTVINQAAVEDVSGIDRKRLRLTDEPVVARALRVTKLDRLALGPLALSILSYRNCAAFLFYLCWSLPVFAFLLWLLTPRTRLERTEPHLAPAVLPALFVLTLVCTAGLLRINLLRLPDVFGTIPILLCWVLSTLLGFDRSRFRLAARATAFVLIVAVVVGVYHVSGGEWQVVPQAARHPSDALAKAAKTTRSTRDWPWARQWPGDDEWKLAVYVHDCTRADDRLLVTWAAPEFFYFSRRVFAGREGALFPLLRPPAGYENSVLGAWTHQSVPIVLTNDESDAEFAKLFPALARHLATAYSVAGTTRWDGRPSITVHVDKNRVPSRRDPEFGLPCFTNGPDSPASGPRASVPGTRDQHHST